MDILDNKYQPRQFTGWSGLILLTALTVGVGYVLGLIGYAVTDPLIKTTPFWLLSGLSLVLYYFYGRRALPGIFLSVLLLTCAYAERPFWMCILMAAGNTLEPILAVLFIRWMRRVGSRLGAFRESLTLSVAAFVTPIPSAFIGGILVGHLHKLDFAGTLQCMGAWWTGHVIGILVLTPLLFAWIARPKVTWEQWGRFALFLVLLAGTAAFIFFHTAGPYFLFLLFPILLMASCWLPNSLLFLLGLALQICAIVASQHGGGAFRTGSDFQNFLNLQIFLSTVGVTTLILTAFRFSSPLKAPALALLVGWIFSGILFALVTADGMSTDKERAARRIADIEQDIQNRFTSCTDAMSSVMGYLAGSKRVRRNEWLAFTEHMAWEKRHPGLKGVGIVRLVARPKLHALEEDMRARGYENFKVHSPWHDLNPSTDALVVSFVAPEEGNTGALGLDLSAEKSRREAALHAAGTGQATLATNIQLVTEKPGQQNYAVFMPFFMPGTQGAFKGFVYGPFLPTEFFQAVFSQTDHQMQAEIFLDTVSPEHMIFRSEDAPLRAGGAYEKMTSLVLGERFFKIGWRRSVAFQSSLGFASVMLSCIGTLLTLCLAGVVNNLELAGTRARRLVKEKTVQLAERNNQFAEQAAMLGRIMDSVPVGIFRVDRQGRLGLCNEEWGRITGRAARASRGGDWLTLFSPDERERATELLTQAADGHAHAEFRVVRPNGDIRNVAVVLVPETGLRRSELGFLGTLQDFTEYKAAQEVMEMQRAVVAHSAKMASLGEMAGGIAHEINNPLAIIYGKSRQMRRLIETGVRHEPETLLSALDLIERTTMRISKIIKGLRAFSRSGEQDPFVKESVPHIVDQTLDLCRERFKNEGIDLRVGAFPSVEVDCRSTQVGQVLMNLLSNAFDAVQDLPERWVSLDAQEWDDRVQISVTDSGFGIDPQVREKIFQPFFTTKDLGHGTGLGLSIARGIIADHAGKLYIDESFRHTRFVMELRKSLSPPRERLN